MHLATWFWLIAARSALANTLRMFAAQKAAMVEEELQQLQIARAHLPTQEKVASQPAVDVLDDRTGTHHLLAQSTHRLLHRVETATQLFTQGRLFLPT